MTTTASVYGFYNGLSARNDGGGTTNINASGSVIGSDSAGISAYAGTSGTGLSVTATERVSGRYYGIRVRNEGGGTTSVITSGTITVTDSNGVGIYVDSQGSSATQITTNGLVEGGRSAIFVNSTGQPVTITANGLVRNVLQRSTSLTVEGGGGPIAFTNAGGLIGTVRFGAGAHVMTNAATWNTAGGSNQFGGGTLINNNGSAIIAANNGGVIENTTFDGLASFVNRGVLALADGNAGDTVRQSGGNARFEAGSLLAIDINSAGQSDRFMTTGTATLSGARLAVNVVGGIAAYGTRYLVISADGGLSGQFDGVSGIEARTAFTRLQDTYDANHAYLEVLKYRNFADAGLMPNQISTGHGLDSLGPGVLVGVIGAMTSDAQARAAFDQLSGEPHASAITTLIHDSQFQRAAVIDRLRGSFDAPGASTIPVMSYAPGGPTSVKAGPSELFSIWGQGFGGAARWNGNGNAARLNRSIAGFNVGIDMPVFGGWRVGALAGYGSTGLGARNGSGQADNYHLGVYAGAQYGAWGIRAGAVHSWHDIAMTRMVAFNGFYDLLRARYDARTTQIFGDIGYRVAYGGAAFEPFANLAYVNLRTQSFQEIGGPAALASFGNGTSLTYTTLGVRGSTDFVLGGVWATARSTLGWRHAIGATTPTARLAFVGGTPFDIAGAPIARDAAVVEAGLDLRIAPGAALGFNYSGQFGGAFLDQSVKANLAVRF
ncbi:MULTISPECIES: autotransporter domain-containing protein [unclassified Beijerinckia]|uniref:autotransporter outer membrane beta-barrel domain-containing protein n=1 Tax=unclassified Beijerinckia TaxID=2638183 RepID=UPI0008941C8F|nr:MULTISPECIES: autotransporter domain-containing protein [unclassified Beijerinckia]MDH7794598.1 outer membrane autotransporter protein [Beijerinckia sp. GAS462]SEB68008.1 outer membrane autotransporter barrel domain-containing protein [Beijerinckia sp. 28-YEA-48]